MYSPLLSCLNLKIVLCYFFKYNIYLELYVSDPCGILTRGCGSVFLKMKVLESELQKNRIRIWVVFLGSMSGLF